MPVEHGDRAEARRVRVIQTIPMTSELSRCESNSGTRYAFSSRYTMNGAVINEYVYRLVGLGSYAR
ncbi:hypothetical protein [Streptomyces sp. NPDC050264]|uniref:hypothetical protein n=1 Tax=Streptomyces sp. NPDC050264 TaxID=3155038 RepID=UPI003449754F